MGELVVVQTEYDHLIEEIRKLREKIAELIAERDELVNHTCRDLQAEYDLKIGGLMLQAMEAENRVRMLKRTLELMQMQINHGRCASYTRAKKQTEQEYKEYQEKINDKAEDIRRSREYSKQKKERRASQEPQEGGETRALPYVHDECSECKQLYRKIVKRIHPDINPDITEEEKVLFNKASQAYKDMDAETLRNILYQLQAGGDLNKEFSNTPDDIERLRQVRDSLLSRIRDLTAEIRMIKNSFPYSEKDFLEDEKAVAAKQKELREYIMDCTAQAAILDGRIKNLKEQGYAA